MLSDVKGRSVWNNVNDVGQRQVNETAFEKNCCSAIAQHHGE